MPVNLGCRLSYLCGLIASHPGQAIRCTAFEELQRVALSILQELREAGNASVCEVCDSEREVER